MAVMDKGKIKQVGSPAEFFHKPANLFVASFIGSTPMNLIDAVIRNGKVAFGNQTFDIPANIKDKVSESQEVVYGVRPEYVEVAQTTGHGFATGPVKVMENLGTHYLITIDCDGILFRGTAPDGSEPQMNSMISLHPQDGRVLLYDKKSEDLIQ